MTRLPAITPPCASKRNVCRGAYPIVQIVYNTYGFTKGMRDSDAPEDVWQLGGPVFFPYLVYPNGGNSGSIRHDYQLGVPIDDTTTWHISYRSYTFPPEIQVPRQARIPYVEVPLRDENGDIYPGLCAGPGHGGVVRAGRDHRSDAGAFVRGG